MSVERVEIDFAIPVEITSDQHQRLAAIVQEIAKANCPDGWVHWASGFGDRPKWSKHDAEFLGKDADPDAPQSGEPTFEDSVYCIETSAREAWPGEIERKKRRRSKMRTTRWYQKGVRYGDQ